MGKVHSRRDFYPMVEKLCETNVLITIRMPKFYNLNIAISGARPFLPFIVYKRINSF